MAEYIEREAFLSDTTQRYCINCDSYNGVRCRACWVNDMQGEVEDFPAADVAPVVHGRWIHDINNLYGCSECMERETMSPKKLKLYCPNCGAKMDGGKHETD